MPGDIFLVKNDWFWWFEGAECIKALHSLYDIEKLRDNIISRLKLGDNQIWPCLVFMFLVILGGMYVFRENWLLSPDHSPGSAANSHQRRLVRLKSENTRPPDANYQPHRVRKASKWILWPFRMFGELSHPRRTGGSAWVSASLGNAIENLHLVACWYLSQRRTPTICTMLMNVWGQHLYTQGHLHYRSSSICKARHIYIRQHLFVVALSVNKL